MSQRARGLVVGQEGSVAVSVALVLVVLLGMAAVAIDYGHLTSVHSELKKAAEAGALAGSRFLVPYVGVPATPNWISGRDKATQTVLLNRADNQTLTDCQVEYGYWSLTSRTLQSSGIAPTASHLPAVQVTITKAAEHNGGPIQMYFAPILGVTTRDLSARAVAVISGPYSVPAGGAFPMAMPKSAADKWNEQPYPDVYIGSAYHDPEGGQWTSFLSDANDVTTIRDLMDSGNPMPLKVGDNIWIEPGTKTTLYEDAAAKIGQTVLVPVVDTDFATHAYTPILGFAAFYIEDAQGGSSKYIKGHFVPNYPDPNNNDPASAGGPVFGYFLPQAKLVY
jgi:Putative Tad-like Flp pilus-assembly